MSEKAPAFCSVCGQPLISTTKQLAQGFDPFTGKPQTTAIPMLACPERGESKISAHDRWEQNPDNSAGKWERWDG